MIENLQQELKEGSKEKLMSGAGFPRKDVLRDEAIESRSCESDVGKLLNEDD